MEQTFQRTKKLSGARGVLVTPLARNATLFRRYGFLSGDDRGDGKSEHDYGVDEAHLS